MKARSSHSQSLNHYYSDLQKYQTMVTSNNNTFVKKDYSSPNILKQNTYGNRLYDTNKKYQTNNIHKSSYLNRHSTQNAFTSFQTNKKLEKNKLTIQKYSRKKNQDSMLKTKDFIDYKASYGRKDSGLQAQFEKSEINSRKLSTDSHGLKASEFQKYTTLNQSNKTSQQKLKENNQSRQSKEDVNQYIQKQLKKFGFEEENKISLGQSEIETKHQQEGQISHQDESFFISTCNKIYSKNYSDNPNSSQIRQLLNEISMRDSIYDMVKATILKDKELSKEQEIRQVERYFKRQKLLLEIIEEFKRMSQLQQMTDYQQLYYFLKGNQNK